MNALSEVKRNIQYLFSGFLLVGIFMSCSSNETSLKKQTPTSEKLDKSNTAGNGKLIPIDFNDANYSDISSYAKDTVTKGGWSVKYLVKDDSTKYRDLYIQWGKGAQKGIYTLAEVLELRSYFVPVYQGENDHHLFFTYACATTCKAVLTLSKDKDLTARDFNNVADFNIHNGQVVYIADREEETKLNENKADKPHEFKVTIVDLNQNVEKVASFKNKPIFNQEDQNIDSVFFGKNQIKLSATLLDRKDRTGKKTIREEQAVSLGN